MSYDLTAIQPAHPANLDDEITALALQLEEINRNNEKQKGKYPADNPPDIELAFSTFQAEVLAHIGFLSDLKLARSIAHAVDTDGQVIADITRGEAQAQQDRRLAFQISGDDPELEAPSPYTEVDFNISANISTKDERLHWVTSVLSDDSAIELDDQDDNVGPSMTYAERRGEALEKISLTESQCCVCCNHFRSYEIIRLQCEDLYCTDCLKGLFMRATKDQTLFPPRCCRQQIPLLLIAAELSADELDVFNSAEIEFSTKDRTYCCNVDCGRFIPPSQIRADRAECGRCGSATCAMCKNAFHRGDCAADPSLQATLALATSQGWQRCFTCGALVELNVGCFHMT